MMTEQACFRLIREIIRVACLDALKGGYEATTDAVWFLIELGVDGKQARRILNEATAEDTQQQKAA